MKPKRIILTGWFFCFVFSVHAFALPAFREAEIKAAFLYQFTKFIEWPENLSSTQYNICVFKDDSFGEVLDKLRSSDEESAVQFQTRMVDNLDSLDGCHLLFISAKEKGELGRIVEGAKGRKLVTVSEVKGFIEKGGIINFVIENRKIRFEINQKQAEAEGIKISSKLLKLASAVKT